MAEYRCLYRTLTKDLMEADTKKSGKARKQRVIYETIQEMGLEYLM